ncbi:hypothetical protein ACS2UU_27200, partial [Bacillus cereus group sp. BC254]
MANQGGSWHVTQEGIEPATAAPLTVIWPVLRDYRAIGMYAKNKENFYSIDDVGRLFGRLFGRRVAKQGDPGTS